MLTALFDGLKGSRRRPTAARRDVRSRRPLLEPMEQRQLLSNYVLIGAASVVEGTGPAGTTTPMDFRVSLGSPATQEVRVDYRTTDLTARAGEDYVAAEGTLVFNPGEQVRTIRVEVVADDVIEPTEYFQVLLSNPVNATLIQSAATGTILDDDAPVAPELSINDVSMRRGLNGSRLMTFTLSLNTTLTTPVTVRASTANLTAVAGLDYEAKSELLTIAPGQRTVTFTVRIFGRATHVSDRAFTVRLTEASTTLRKVSGIGVLQFGD